MYSDMNNFLNIKSVLLGVILGIGGCKLWSLFNDERTKFTRKTTDIVSDGLFFTPKKLACTNKCVESGASGKGQLTNLFLPCNSCSSKRLIYILKKARNQLDICMYLITSCEICEAVLQLFRKGVKIRIIIDKQMSEDAYGADVVSLRKEYVPIKVIQSSHIMHNKFVVIDEETVMTGSLNWTRQGLLGNYENVIVTTDKAVAKKFSYYFQFLWDLQNE